MQGIHLKCTNKMRAYFYKKLNSFIIWKHHFFIDFVYTVCVVLIVSLFFDKTLQNEDVQI